MIPLGLGAIGWFATSFFGGPIKRFFDLRGEIIKQTIAMTNVRATEKEVPGELNKVKVLDELSKEDMECLIKAISTFRDLGAQMKALWLNNPWAMWIVTKLFRYDVCGAGTALIGLSNRLHRYGSERHEFRKKIESTLRFRSGD